MRREIRPHGDKGWFRSPKQQTAESIVSRTSSLVGPASFTAIARSQEARFETPHSTFRPDRGAFARRADRGDQRLRRQQHDESAVDPHANAGADADNARDESAKQHTYTRSPDAAAADADSDARPPDAAAADDDAVARPDNPSANADAISVTHGVPRRPAVRDHLSEPRLSDALESVRRREHL
ncbi:MAG: hypothetical protein ABI346_08390 [Candidatus Baltobacteraceae bacterium]